MLHRVDYIVSIVAHCVSGPMGYAMTCVVKKQVQVLAILAAIFGAGLQIGHEVLELLISDRFKNHKLCFLIKVNQFGQLDHISDIAVS